MKDIDTLPEELDLYGKADQAIGTDIALMGWYSGLTDEERQLLQEHVSKIADRFREALDAYSKEQMEASRDLFNHMRPIFFQIGQAFSEALAAGLTWPPGWDPVEMRAYRAYANYLNWRRPRGHKLSWLGLNRAQRAEALTWWETQQELGNAAWPEW